MSYLTSTFFGMKFLTKAPYLLRRFFRWNKFRDAASRILNILVILSMVTPNLFLFVEAVHAAKAFTSDFIEVEQTDNPVINGRPIEYQPPLLTQPVYRYAEGESAPPTPNFNNARYKFVENVGQFDSDVRYVLQGYQGSVFITQDAIWVTLFEDLPVDSNEVAELHRYNEDPKTPNGIVRKGVNLKISFPDSNQNNEIEGFDPIDEQISYFLGNDPDKWQVGVPVWGGVRYKDIYPGVDLEISGTDGNWDWGFVANDASLLESAAVRIEGAESISFPRESGVIQVETGFGVVVFPGFRAVNHSGVGLDMSYSHRGTISQDVIHAPYMAPSELQDEDVGPGGKLNSLAQEDIYDEFGSLGKVFSTYFGGADVEYMAHSAVDQSGKTYVALETCSSDLEETPGSIVENFPETCDIYVAKFSSDGTALEYGVYLGGNQSEDTWGLAVDQSGNAYVTGITYSLRSENASENFPTTLGAFQTEPLGSTDGFVTKIDNSGTSLVFSSLLGGDNSDYPQAITVDSNENVYVAGSARSREDTFPITGGVFQSVHSTGYNFDGFVGKINSSGANLEYLTYLGGDSTDYLFGISVNEDGDAYVVGYSDSSNYPNGETSSYQSFSGESDIIVTALDSTGSAIIYTTYLGGTGVDYGAAISLDLNGEAVITGYTDSSDFPIEHPYQSSFAGEYDAFITKLNQDGSGLEFSTYFGGSSSDEGAGIAIDRFGGIWVAGITWSADFPKPDLVSLNGSTDVFLLGISPLGDQLVYSSIFGGSGYEASFMSYAKTDLSCWENTITVSGVTDSSDFPVTSGAYQEIFGGAWYDGFVTRFYLPNITVVPDEVTYSDVCTPDECPVATTSGGFTDNHVADPINTRNGGWSYTNTDISVPVLGGALTFTRFYNSLVTDLYTEPLGYGWTHNHDLRLIFLAASGDEDAKVIFKGPSANQYTFYDLGNGIYSPYPGLLATLEYESGAALPYSLVDSSQNTYYFDENGRIGEKIDANGVALSYSYNPDGTLDTVTDESGSRYLEYSYTGSAPARIDAVIAHTGTSQRQVSFTYTSGDLVTYTDLVGETWTYGYNAGHQVVDIFSPPVSNPQLFIHNDYDAEGRAYQQFDGEGTRLAYITYNEDGTSVVLDGYGNASTHSYDSRNTLANETSAMGVGLETEYDPNFRPQLITTSGGESLIALDWSEDGSNLESYRDPLNNETFLSYDEFNNVTSVIDPNDYQTNYEYQDANFPTQVTKIEYPISYDGGVTWMSTEYEYYQPGNFEGQPAGKVKLLTSNGYQTYFEYNEFGQSTLVIRGYGTSSPLSTEYTYDEFGRRVETVSPEGLITRTVYDNADRVLAVIGNCMEYYPTDCMQNSPQNFHGADGSIYNLLTSYTYDSRGNRIAITDTSDNITRTYFDNFDRVTSVVRNWDGSDIFDETPPDRSQSTLVTNLRTDYVLDANGQQIAGIDQVGRINRTYFDADGRTSAVVRNLVGQSISIETLPVFDPAYPDQNIVTRYFYDDRGNLIATLDVDGRINRTYYDAANRAYAAVQNWDGTIQDLDAYPNPPDRSQTSSDTNLRTDTVYDPNGNVIATIDPAGIVTRTYYDSLNRPITTVQNFTGVIDPSDHTPPTRGTGDPDENLRTDTFYNEQGQVEATQDPAGLWTKFEYSTSGQLVRTIRNPWAGEVQNYRYDNGSYVEIYNIISENVYNANGQLIETISPDGMVTRTEYNDNGAVARVIRNCKFRYPEDCITTGYPKNYLNEFNLVTEYQYNVDGQLEFRTDTQGLQQRTEYDQLGRVIRVTANWLEGQFTNYYDGATETYYNIETNYYYDHSGMQIAIQDTNGTITRTYYDDFGRAVTVVKNLTGDYTSETPPTRGTGGSDENIRIDTYYLGNGSVDHVVDAEGASVNYLYDGLGRLESVIDPLGNETQYEYDVAGDKIFEISPRQIVGENLETKYEYDQLHRLTAVVENYHLLINPDAETNVRTEYTYDISGNLTQIVDANQHTTSYQYNGMNQRVIETDPVANTWKYEFDESGNLKQVIDANGVTVNYSYDSLNRLTLIDYPGTDQDVSYTYNVLGQQTSITDNVGTTSLEYNLTGKMTSAEDPFNNLVSYAYDYLGNQTAITYPGDQVVYYSYNDLNFLKTVTDWQQQVTIYDYWLTGRLKEAALPNGVVSSYVYNAGGQLTNLTNSNASGEISSFAYQYDKIGNRYSAIEEFVSPGGGTALLSEQDALVDWNDPGVTSNNSLVSLSTIQGADPSTSTTSPPATTIPTLEPEATATATPMASETAALTPTASPTATPTATPTPTTTTNPAPAGGLVVTSIEDGGDSSPGDGLCNNEDGVCTLRAAIEEANALPGSDTIVFDIPGEGPYIIQPAAALPEITDPVIIDGTTQTGYTDTPLIVLDGSMAGEWVSGLTIAGGDSQVTGLAITNFDRAGIHLLSDRNAIEGNLIGMDASGSAAFGNRIGILIEEAKANKIGGPRQEASNWIAGNQIGIYLYGSETSGNRLMGNQIGTGAGEDTTPGNFIGVRINSARGNAIGKGQDASRNDFAGNDHSLVLQNVGEEDNSLQDGVIEPAEEMRLVPEGITLQDAPADQPTGPTGDIRSENPVSVNNGGLWDQGQDYIQIDTSLSAQALENHTFLVSYAPFTGAAEEPAIVGITFVVVSTGTKGDNDPGDGVCDAGRGICTLPAAIEEANALPGTDTITFNIEGVGPHSFQSRNPLPTITDPVIIDGTTQPGYAGTPLIELDGSNAGAGVNGLTISAGSSAVRGLAINRFDGYGIEINSNGGNTLEANFIGTDTSGTLVYGTLQSGVYVNNSADNTIGGTAGEARNLISGNWGGVSIYGVGATGNQILGNYIGMDVTGEFDLGNFTYGINISGAPNNTVGGLVSGAGNVISGNGDGIRINGTGASGNQVQGNMIGTNPDGTAELGNSHFGIKIESANNTVGGTTAEARNLISGNDTQGILIAGSEATGNVVQGNYIGTDAAGTTAIGNSLDGIVVDLAANTTIGGTAPGAGNLISGNRIGIYLYTGSSSTVIAGNTIGTDITGTLPMGNSLDGIAVSDSSGNTLGGTAAGTGNLLSANGRYGVFLAGVDSTGNLVAGNHIGTDLNGVSDLGNTESGVAIGYGSGNTVGGTTVEARNLISGNDQAGVVIAYAEATGNLIQGNYIGVDASGTLPLGNTGRGVQIQDASNNTVGGASPGAGNVIANNGSDGVYVVIAAGTANGNAIFANRIFANTGLGIDLAPIGVTVNDPGDGDTGPNNLQNFPVITAASSDGTSSAAVEGTLNTAAVTTFRVEFFSNAACDLSGNGEGESYLGFTEVTTDVNGDASFSAVLPVGVAPGQFVTATATDPNGNTSEFSACQESIQTSTSLSQNWHYEYDPLNRLTYACNDWNAVTETCDGSFYQYTYDATGNRLTQTTELLTNNYVYDPANRLTSVDGMTYTYDNNGNLLNDGVNTYTYNYANRMVALTDGVNVYSYAYNGRGDRLQQTVNGVTTNYTLDLNAGLTQVLSDGTSKYLYGNGRIGEYAAGQWTYYATDALGSVRQIVDASGQVVFYQAYAPYGEVRVSAGQGGSMYGFANEWTDATGLQYLRARYMDPRQGRFISRDPSNLGSNLFTYASSNPINDSDPSGLFSTNLDGPSAFSICFALHSILPYGQNVEGVDIGMVTVGQAIDICKAAYSQNLWNENWFDLVGEGGLPTSGHNLFGWYLFEAGSQNHLIFDADDVLTQELINSKSIDKLRYKYFISGESLPLIDIELEYDLTEQAQCLLTRENLPSRWLTGFPLACVMGSYNYQIVPLGDGWHGFRIDNRTDLASGSHFAGRHEGYHGSVEELLRSGIIKENELLFNVYSSEPVISILSARTRGETNSYTGLFGEEHDLGGGNLTQTYVWKEKPCNISYWFLGHLIYSRLDYEIEKWDKYESYTYLPSKLAP